MQIAVRCYVHNKGNRKISRKQPISDRILVFDTETTTDMYQNLKFGSFRIYQNNIHEHSGLFHDPKIISDKELKTIKNFCKRHMIDLYTRKEFIEKIFYPEIYYLGTLCVGFNLPFDLSRLAIGYGSARGSMKNGFSFKLSQNKKYPRLRIKHINNKMSFISFGSGLNYYGDKYSFRGNFLDLRTLAFALTNENHSLKSASKLFDTQHKKTEAEHGKISKKYLQYNFNDVKSTYDLYLKLKQEYENYNLELPITRVYSPASIGKNCLDNLRIESFLDKNSDFPKKVLGYLMTTYFGGRSEVRIRKTPTKITLVDFLSMYPTVCILQDLWKFIISDRIEQSDDTEKIKKFVNEIKLEDLRKKSTWKQLNAIVLVKPDDDILPTRARYNQETFNIGLNYTKSKKALWYTLSDVIASKLLTGKSPKILRAIRFTPSDIQNDLRKTSILDIEIDPRKQDFFKLLIEKRKSLQRQVRIKGTDKVRRNQLDSKQKALKIIANASSYGIFVEINPEKKRHTADVYGLKHFKQETDKIERFGRAFNPIIAVLITSASRLILAITEVLLRKHNETYAFCDTDSMAIPCEYLNEIQDFFESLNPYNFRSPLFKVEHENVWFYGISAKRYALYRKTGKKIEIIKHSLHGLGHLESPFNRKDWEKELWLDILKEHYGTITNKQFNQKYSNLFAVCQFTASTPKILKRFNKINKKKNYDKSIKPFNFILVGTGKKDVKPVAPFSKNSQEVVYNKFIDYNTGEVLKGIEYWKPLDITLHEYKNHPESKFDGELGVLKRRKVNVTDVIHIGKESNSIDTVGILNQPHYTTYDYIQHLTRSILDIRPQTASRYGIRRNTLFYIKKRLSTDTNIRISKKTKERISKLMKTR